MACALQVARACLEDRALVSAAPTVPQMRVSSAPAGPLSADLLNALLRYREHALTYKVGCHPFLHTRITTHALARGVPLTLNLLQCSILLSVLASAEVQGVDEDVADLYVCVCVCVCAVGW